MATDFPDNAQAIAQWLNGMIYKLKSAPYLTAAIQALVNEDILPWLDTAEGQETRSIAVGFLGKLFGGLAGGALANGVENASNADVEALVAIVVKPPAQLKAP